MTKTRIDQVMVLQGKVQSRAQASMLIKKGVIFIGDNQISKAGYLVRENQQIEIREEIYVSRGAYKLIHALKFFNVNVNSLVAADVGASTGGFTQVLLQQGVKKVYAIDVGIDQMSPVIKSDPRVISLDATNIRNGVTLPEMMDLVVVDLSFISLKLVINEIIKLGSKKAQFIFLIKPQFEVGREFIGKKGVVDIKYHLKVIDENMELMKKNGLINLSQIESPILGKEGNKEYLVYGHLS